MVTVGSAQINRPRSLRLWPGVAIVALQWFARFGLPVVMPQTTVYGVMAGLLGGLAVVVWWVFFSRAPWLERWGAILLMVAAMALTSRLLHESIATGGMGMLFYMLAIPVLSLAFVAWAVVCRRVVGWPRYAALIATVLLACGGWTLVRTGGFTSNVDSDFSWRWAESPEDRLLAQTEDEPTALLPDPAAGEATPGWPGFRGPGRDSVIHGVQIATDWSAKPPVELWRRPIGPGWSSFAVRGDLVYTQEQRGDDEDVACYRLATGELLWRHHDSARFWESNGGAGPRATPTLSGTHLLTFGGTGILNALDAISGAVVWSSNAATDAETEVPMWGFSSSPLVVDGVVIVAAAGTLVAYDLATGDLLWVGPDGGGGYSSPHLLTIDGVSQVLLLSQAGATSVDPTDGIVLWEYSWPAGERIVQPALTEDGDLLISTGDGSAMRRVAVAQGPDGWTTEERWTSNRLKPNFNDFVVHDGHAYGFDGNILASISVEDGERTWKGGRYGAGQLVLLADQDLLLVISEKGELALVAATPDRFTELARFPAVEGKTWNHPVLVDGVLLVRNAEEMVAFRLALAGG